MKLTCHPETARGAVRSVEVRASDARDGVLRIKYSITGNMKRVRVPEPGTPRHVDGLWKHTCFEAFVARADSNEYVEFNFAPSTEWAMYSFTSYREGMLPILDRRAPEIDVRRRKQRLELDASIRIDGLAMLRGSPLLRLALAAVVEEEDGRLSYWALRHTCGKPDFHHPDSFAIELHA